MLGDVGWIMQDMGVWEVFEYSMIDQIGTEWITSDVATTVVREVTVPWTYL